jgi:hypothetical protein
LLTDVGDLVWIGNGCFYDIGDSEGDGTAHFWDYVAVRRWKKLYRKGNAQERGSGSGLERDASMISMPETETARDIVGLVVEKAVSETARE